MRIKFLINFVFVSGFDRMHTGELLPGVWYSLTNPFLTVCHVVCAIRYVFASGCWSGSYCYVDGGLILHMQLDWSLYLHQPLCAEIVDPDNDSGGI